ncbi:MAG: hypothetical protein ACMUIS_09555 [bacterium]
MGTDNRKKGCSFVRMAVCIGIILAFLGLSGCGCLTPDVPCVPGARTSLTGK